VTKGLRSGDIVDGTVAKIADLSAFVDLGQSVEGLVDISEMPDGMTAVSSIVPDSPIKVRVLRVDNGWRRISFSLEHVENVALLPAKRPLTGTLYLSLAPCPKGQRRCL
jgi:ribosomal protein S1